MADLDPDTDLTGDIRSLMERDWPAEFVADYSAAIGGAIGALIQVVNRLSLEVDNLYEVVADLKAGRRDGVG